MTVPDIIWSQISKATKMACGARMPMIPSDNLNAIQFDVTITKGQIHKVIVSLEASDTYTVKLFKFIRGKVLNFSATKVMVVEEHQDIYAENLSETIYSMCNK